MIDIEELREFFNGYSFSHLKLPYRLNNYTTIIDFKEYVRANFDMLDNHPTNPNYSPCWNRLCDLKKHLQRL